jgi:putative RNA 2'-phosphotransferase
MDKKEAQRLSKILTYVLGHRPDEFGLVPDSDGFVKIKDLLKAVCEDKEWKNLRISQINEICLTTSDPPFEIVNSTIRAKNRENLFVPKKAGPPPKLLFTCIRQKAYAHVANKGLQPGVSNHVILSSSEEMATRIGRRSDQEPVLLKVLVKKSLDEGVIFYQAGELLFTAAYIPATCFTGPALPMEKAPAKPKKTESVKPKVPGGYLIELKHMEQNEEKLRLKNKREKTLREKNIQRARKQKKIRQE